MSETRVLTPLRMTDHDVAGPARPDDLAKLSAPLTELLTTELDEARQYLGVTAEELLLAALCRTIGRAVGGGELRVDVHGHRVQLGCVSARPLDATGVLNAVHRGLHSAVKSAVSPPAIAFTYYERLEPSRVDVIPADGHAVVLRAYPRGGVMQLDWWYDTRRMAHTTVDDLAAQFALALIELTSEASPLDFATA
ncbi:MAG: hypothetical protein ACM4D3_09515 [Candidatus Sericytochromatia bacterium]